MTNFANVAECLRSEDLFILNPWRTDTLDRGYPEYYVELYRSVVQGVDAAKPDHEKWYMPALFCGSDYSGTLVQRSNHDVLLRIAEFEEKGGRLAPNTVVSVCGGHGTYAICIRGDVDNEEIISALCAVSDYPLLDENDHSEQEVEAQYMAWDNGGFGLRREFARALEIRAEAMGLCDDDDGENIDLAAPHVRDMVDDLFSKVRDSVGEEWRNEQGSDMWIDVDRVVDGVEDDEIVELLEASKPSGE